MRLQNTLILLAGTTIATAGVYIPNAHSNEKSFSLEEIVVTSRKREETLQETPVSVTALTGDLIEKRSMKNFVDINNYVPNLELNNGRVDGGGSVAQLFIRGVGQDDYSFPMEPGVGLYLDGVYVSRSSAGDFGFLDVERIEVLRGPQGTLYGKNTIGGAVKVETIRPTGENSGRIEATYGRYDLLEFVGSADFALADKLWMKVAGMTRSRDGYGRALSGEELRNENKDAVRLGLRYMPTDNLDVYLQADYSRQNQNGSFGTAAMFWPGPTADLVDSTESAALIEQWGLQPPFDSFGPGWVNNVKKTKNFTTGDTDDTRDINEIFGTSLTLDWTLDNVDLKSITAYREVNIDVQRDGDHTPYHVFTVGVVENSKQYSQEFQVTGNSFDGKMPWVFGLFVMDERASNVFQAPLLAGVYDAIGLDVSLDIFAKMDSLSLAGFGEGTYYFTPNFGLTLGARYTYDKKKYDYSLNRLFTGVVVIPAVQLKESWNEFLPKVGLEYKINDDLLSYATYAKGYKAGGWNPRSLLPAETPQKFDPEYIDTFEVGLKSTLWNGRATFNVSAFYSDYKDIQLISVTAATLPDGTMVAGTGVDNAGKGEIYGAEFELVARPIEALRVTAALGLLQTKYKELGPDPIANGISLDNDFIQSPKLTFNSSAEYVVGLGNGSSITINGDVSYKSKIHRTVQNFPELVTSSYWILNSRVSFMPGDERYKISAYVTNITNEIFIANGTDVRGLGITEVYWSRPREWGVSISAYF